MHVQQARVSQILAMVLNCAAVREQPAGVSRNLVRGTADGFFLGPESWTELYDINDMLPRQRNQPLSSLNVALFGPPPTPGAMPMEPFGAPGQYVGRLSRPECVDAIIKHIEKTVAPGSWQEVGDGGAGEIREITTRGLLLVRQSKGNQRRIAALLQNLREHPRLLIPLAAPSASTTEPTTEPAKEPAPP
jgi:hypothetical protein